MAGRTTGFIQVCQWYQGRQERLSIYYYLDLVAFTKSRFGLTGRWAEFSIQ